MMEISYKSSVIISKQDLLDALELDATMKLTIMSGLFSVSPALVFNSNMEI